MNVTPGKLKVLFLCTGNSCRSQMAEAWARALKGDVLDAYSAGIHAHGLNRVAVQVMSAAGIDMSLHRSKTVDKLGRLKFDYVVTVCDRASETCPVFHGNAKIVHKGFDDPPHLAASASSDEDAFGHYERVRDEIQAFVETLPGSLEELASKRDARAGSR